MVPLSSLLLYAPYIPALLHYLYIPMCLLDLQAHAVPFHLEYLPFR